MTALLAREIGRAGRQRSGIYRDAEIRAWRDLLASIDGADWHRPTVCDAWDVADIVGHLIGQAEDVIRPWSFPLRFAKGKRAYPGVPRFDAHMMVQADEHRGTPLAELRALFERGWEKATRRIARNPGLVRRITMQVDDVPRMDLGYVHDILLTRDLWMHRDDVCRSLGRSFDAGPYATEIIAQVIYDLEAAGPYWNDRPSIVLELTGPGGGTYRLGTGEPVGHAAVDAVAYMRTLSGRNDNPAVSGDPAAAEAVATCRMGF